MMETLFSIILSFTLHSASSTDCNDYFQCESQTITDTANCFGYASCHATTIQTDNSCHCDGAHACHSTYCRSVASCKDANLQISSEIYCEGILCLCNHNQHNIHYNLNTYSGVESCADSTINTTGKV